MPDNAQRMERDGIIKALYHSVNSGHSEYSVGDLSIPGLRHFMYKSRPQVQVTMPTYEDPYGDASERRRYVLNTASAMHQHAGHLPSD